MAMGCTSRGSSNPASLHAGLGRVSRSEGDSASLQGRSRPDAGYDISGGWRREEEDDEAHGADVGGLQPRSLDCAAVGPVATRLYQLVGLTAMGCTSRGSSNRASLHADLGRVSRSEGDSASLQGRSRPDAGYGISGGWKLSSLMKRLTVQTAGGLWSCGSPEYQALLH